VERLSPSVRPQARYERTLDLLRTVRQMDTGIHTKSGIMLGLGETHEEVVRTLRDLREAGVSGVTIGQYLRPSTTQHLPVQEYVHPDRFAEYERLGDEMGFLFVASGPFVRSSYNAQAFSEKLLADRLARVGVVA
jgi:lipoic acid synthetase